MFGMVIYSSSGQYAYTTVNSVGCDSIATLNLIITGVATSTTYVSQCESFDWNGMTYTNTGQYILNE